MKIMAILNSQSIKGKRKQIESALTQIPAKFDVEIKNTGYAGHATKIARDAVKGQIDMVIAIGGDGTVNEVLNGIIGTNVTLGIIPTGTANDLASYLGIPTNINKARDIIFNHRIHLTDIIQVNDWYYLTSGGIGLPCEILAVTDAIRRKRYLGKFWRKLFGRRFYVIGLLIAVTKSNKQKYALRIQSNDSYQTIDVRSLISGNQPVLGRYFHILPDAVNNDGKFDVYIIKNDGQRINLLRTLLKTLNGSHTEMPNVNIFRTNNLSIQTSRPIAFFGDGEILQYDTRFDMRIIPRAVKIAVPDKS